ncbi:dihydroxyacetone kinase phosphoryl donor subunit DhaM [Petrocella sp. FN5]|uniref:dihydroxyacetone kinase phosphoryl donor subunit DhaM n=1 Tax=Petrocella sp. FN5 TaxID=3032002 RepID=UPI0023DC2E74|nr:dihydroxyacetone kinase phosphoryl donor subunit DhaM [Petrocella sp. FN5]MDF1616705.1 dihydroxyacetone kinase phosphoryl donor subunit DhaM [Petrocella sp. FN5]
MVGIVVVSHSKKVAEGIVELSMQMAGVNQKIIAAGGMENGEIGTDAVRIATAVKEAETGKGVVILVDLGSAVISSNLAIELLEEEGLNIDVRIADGPVLEGAVSASVQAYIGGTIDEVVSAAELARDVLKLQ